ATAVDELGPVASALGLEVSHVDFAAAAAATAEVVISTVPAGAADPLATALRWPPETVLLDVLYHPWPTPLAAAAATAGCRVVSGLDMLLGQAARQFELFTGVSAPVVAMRAALTSHRHQQNTHPSWH
ncbi:MAG: shikimate dehydrogenase, partial [Dactylosporangium sp.]|nr:shikimate dehydrogenase [Dactylosporangium sp.]